MYVVLSELGLPHVGAAPAQTPGLIQIAADDPVTVQLNSVAGLAGSAIDLNIKVPMTGLRFVIFREVAPDITFSHGFRMKNSWIVGINEVEKLQILVPSGFDGRVILEAQFHRAQGGAAARGLMSVGVKNDTTPQPPSNQVIGTAFKQEQPAQKAVRPMGLSAREEEEELARGQKLVSGGDIATARLIFQNLALRGSVPATRYLAETYDPQLLARMAVTGLQPDLETARKWYRIASDAGDSEASIRLNVLARQ
jgi:TPR repeat protein